jgi:hypothetical protein
MTSGKVQVQSHDRSARPRNARRSSRAPAAHRPHRFRTRDRSRLMRIGSAERHTTPSPEVRGAPRLLLGEGNNVGRGRHGVADCHDLVVPLDSHHLSAARRFVPTRPTPPVRTSPVFTTHISKPVSARAREAPRSGSTWPWATQTNRASMQRLASTCSRAVLAGPSPRHSSASSSRAPRQARSTYPLLRFGAAATALTCSPSANVHASSVATCGEKQPELAAQ